MLVQVVMELPLPRGAAPFSYALPAGMTVADALGRRVLVPFGKQNRLRPGIVVGLAEARSDRQYKTIGRFLDPLPVFTATQLALAEWMAFRFITTPWAALMSMLPGAAKKEVHEILTVIPALKPPSGELGLRYEALCEGALSVQALEDSERSALLAGGWLRLEVAADSKGRPLKVRWLRALLPDREAFDQVEVQTLLGRAEKQRALLLQLTVDGPQSLMKLKSQFRDPAALGRALEAKGLAAFFEEEEERMADLDSRFLDKRRHFLTMHQSAARDRIVEAMEEGRYEAFLLHGITGSGKTEVYLHAAEAALERGKNVLVLVPEIALTSQLVGRFMGRFGDAVAIWHSRLSEGERYDGWRALLRGEKRILIGVRSACLMPLYDLGLVVVDEAHDGSYKQSEPEPRYQARLVAEKLAMLFDCPFVAGTATPGLELYYRTAMHRMTVLALPERTGVAKLPAIHIVDLAAWRRRGHYDLFSPPLVEAMREAFSAGEQVLLMLNRRGFASALVCRECGHTMECPRCEIPLSLHRQDRILRCHYCDHIEPPPSLCPVCGYSDFLHKGLGIEQAVEALQKQFPGVSHVRIDSDSTRRRGDLERRLAVFKEGRAQVLIGTQMIGKGIDIPNVTVVGVLNADLSLSLPDFRAAERSVQLLMQVAGRAGRGDRLGSVFIQTYNPNHIALEAVASHDMPLFYEYEMRVRRELNYPPFSHLLRILFSHEDEKEAWQAAQLMAAWLREEAPDLTLLGPSMAPIERIRDRYRVQLLLKSRDLRRLLEWGQALKGRPEANKRGLRVLPDIDPESVL